MALFPLRIFLNPVIRCDFTSHMSVLKRGFERTGLFSSLLPSLATLSSSLPLAHWRIEKHLSDFCLKRQPSFMRAFWVFWSAAEVSGFLEARSDALFCFILRTLFVDRSFALMLEWPSETAWRFILSTPREESFPG